MIRETTLRQFGGSLGTTLPKAMTDRLNLSAGDQVYVVETEGGILITPHDPNFARAMAAGDKVTRR
jgi:antitoxin MazE